MKATVIPIVIDALGTIPKGLVKEVWFGLLGFMAYQPL